MRFSLSVGAVLLAHFVAAPVQAAEMKLWPNQRANHQVEMTGQAASYKERGRDYVNHTYATGGEEPMPAAESVSSPRDYSLPGSAAASGNTNDIKARKVDINEVAEIIRGSGDAIEPPAPPNMAGADDTSSILGKRKLGQ